MKKAPLTKKTRMRNRPQTNGNDFDTGQLLAALMAFKRGDFSARLPENWTGVPGKIADTFNAVIEANERMTRELERIGRVVGKEGRIAQRASIGEVTNSWADAIGSINNLIGMEQDIRKSRKVGFQHHLVKPIDLNKLDSLIQEGGASLPGV